MRCTATRSGAVGLAIALTLAACGPGSGSAERVPLDIQLAHPGGVVLQIDTVAVGDELTLVTTRVLNGRPRDIQLNGGRENTFLLTDEGERLLLAPPATNTALTVPAGQSIEAALVFTGALPRGERATLVVNQRSASDNVYTDSPRFEAVLPLVGAFGARDVPSVSALSNMRPKPASSLAPAAATGSRLGAGGQAASNLQVVEALRTELGAVQTERGSVVSLPADVTFDFDRATLRPEGRSALDTLVRLIQAEGGDAPINIEGHTDSLGEDAYNLRLSQQRAEAVKAYLVQQGIPGSRLQTSGLGERRPLVPNTRPDGTDDEAARQRNRRVEVVLPQAPATPGSETTPSRPTRGVSTLEPPSG